MCHRLQMMRQEAGLTIGELAELADISASAIYRIEGEASKFNVNVETAQSLADALYLHVEDIFKPSELSLVGRPPHTGKECKAAPKQATEVCPTCFVELPATSVCDECGLQLPTAPSPAVLVR